MKLFRLLLLLFAVPVISGATSPAAPPKADVRAEVQQFMKAYVEAQNKVDATAIMDMVSKRSGVASIMMGEITRGWEAIRANVDEMVGTEGDLRMALGTIDVEEVGPSVALAFAPCTMTLVGEGGRLQLRGALTVVVENTGGKWKLIHEHGSVQIPEGDAD